jgi:SpoVK/Ycf46/Vps4 family AAA+-type ATPase
MLWLPVCIGGNCAGTFFNDTEIKLSDSAIAMLAEHGVKLAVNKKRDNVLLPDDIVAKELFFTGNEKSQLQMLVSLLDDAKLREVQERLVNKALPKGVTVLFHGYPGTGKTESVFQLAKQTNRTIMKVDISQTKSMWFGESEKVIKRIFNDYRTFAKECDKAPILSVQRGRCHHLQTQRFQQFQCGTNRKRHPKHHPR